MTELLPEEVPTTRCCTGCQKVRNIKLHFYKGQTRCKACHAAKNKVFTEQRLEQLQQDRESLLQHLYK